MFTSFLFEPSFGVVNLSGNTVNALGSWETEVTVTTADDIGGLTAEILYAAPPKVNQVVYTAGDTVTYAELANTVEHVTGRKFARTIWDVACLKEELAQDPENQIKKYRLVFAEGKGVAWSKEKSFNAQQGIPTMSAERWARENLKH